MQCLNDLIKSHEGWLTSRIIYYANKHNYVKYTSTLMEATRKATEGTGKKQNRKFKGTEPQFYS
jgi:hypothetical protein